MDHVRMGRMLLQKGRLREDLLEAVRSERNRLPRPGRRRAAIVAGLVLVSAVAFAWRRSPDPAAPRAVEAPASPDDGGRERGAREEAFTALGGRRPLGPPVALAYDDAAGGFATRGDWRPEDEGLRGTARQGEVPGRASARAEVPEEFRLRMKYRIDEGGEAALIVSQGRAGSSARYALPADDPGSWRTIEVVAIDDQVRCVVDGVVLQPGAGGAMEGPRRFVGVAVERGSLSIGDTTLEQVLPGNLAR